MTSTGKTSPEDRQQRRSRRGASLGPVSHVSAEELQIGQRALVLDLAWASLSGALSGGVILAAFALALGATPVQIGLLAAIPFIAQAAQIPASLLIERMRQRRKIAVLTLTAARVAVLCTAALPFLPQRDLALNGLILAQVLIAALNAVGGCAINSWLHQLIPPEQLGNFFSRRLFSGTAVACVGTLAAGAMIDRMSAAGPLRAYAIAFFLAGLAGFVSSFYIARAPEPIMHNAGPATDLRKRILAPFRDPHFRRLLIFIGAWAAASNIAAPFITVYLIEQRGYAVTAVTTMWVVSQLANAVTLYLWGRLSDRLSNKAVLAVALPANFACILALAFVDAVQDPSLQLGALYAVHLVLGVASGGIGLATGNLGLKLAPPGHGTPYLAAIGLVSAFAGGIAPIAAGTLAAVFKASEVSAVLRWVLPGGAGEMAIVTFAHWEFLFVISALAGLYVIHALWRIDEGPEFSERQVVQEFALEAWRSLNSLSSVGGALGNLFPFERLTERRKWWRSMTRAGT
jgi:MFS family permease